MKKLSGIKISHKITSLMIGLVVGFLLMAVAYYAQISSEKTINEANVNIKSIDQLVTASLKSALEMRMAADVYIEKNDEVALKNYNGARMQINESLNLLGSLNKRYVLDEALNVSKDAMKSLTLTFSALADDRATFGFDASKHNSASQSDISSAVIAVTTSLQDYRKAIDPIVKRKIDVATGEMNVARTMFAAVLFATAVGTTLGLFLIYRSIVLPLWHMQRIIAQQNLGNDKARVGIVANDELGDLGKAFNRLLDERMKVLSEQSHENEQLNTSIIGLIRALGSIAKKDLSIKVPVSADVTGAVSDAVNLLTSETAKTLHQVKGYSEKIDRISNLLQAQSAVVLQVAEEERMQVAETVSALNHSAKTMTVIAKEARNANSIAVSAIDLTVKAQDSVIQTVEGIQTIRGTISETEKRIKRLGDRSQEITSIVNLINTIAERTHILALNASMHAASAGEAGKGFAVVAEEVQRLAENARNATSEISAMVNNIRVETSDTVNIMNKLITQVADGTKLAEDSGHRMHETEAATRQLVNHVKSIAVNSMNQANSANRVRDRALLITESTEKTHAKLEEQRLQTDELKNYAQSLMDRVNIFTLPEFRSESRMQAAYTPVIDAVVVSQEKGTASPSPSTIAASAPTANQKHLEKIALSQLPEETLLKNKIA